MKTITEIQNSQLNAIKEVLRKKVVKGTIITGEFVANTNQSKDYLAFVRFYLPSLNRNGITHFIGIELNQLSNIEKCVKHIIDGVNKEHLVYSSLFCE